MLGGSVCIAFIRYALSLVGTILLFALLSAPRAERSRAVAGYAWFGVGVIVPPGMGIGSARDV